MRALSAKVKFLGRSVSSGGGGVEMGDQYIEAIQDWPIPFYTKTVKRFLRFANYQRNSIHHFSEVAAPLYAITGRVAFRWDS